jgi:superfamily II DNA or RNA helicase
MALANSHSHFGTALSSVEAGGRGFEELSAWFLLNDPEWAQRVARVWRWDSWPQRWGPDRGIDLVAETHDGELIAVQCKHYGASTTVSKQDVDSFLSESSREQFTDRVLIATTLRLSAGARQVIAAQEKPVSVVLRDRLDEAKLNWSGFGSEVAMKPPRKEPRPHQERALQALTHRIETADRGQLVMPCGTGKTLTSLWLAERLECSRVLVLLPTLALLRQTAQVWASEARTSFKSLKVCSDRGGSDCELEAADLSVSELGGPVTTDPVEIANFLSGDGRRVLFSTYKSSPRIAEALAQLEGGQELDLAVCDEGHHCAGLTTSDHKTILHDERIPARRRLFVTATPTVFGVKALGQARHAHAELASMDDAKTFGRVLHHLSFKEAIEEGLLCPYQVVVMPVSDEEVAELVQRRKLVTADGDHVTDAYTLAAQIACLRTLRRFECRRLVAFHASVENSKRFAADLETAHSLLGDQAPSSFHSTHIDGYMSKVERDGLLHRFSSEDETPQILSNVRLLAEGVDVPGIDAICLVDTHRNTSAVVQAIGRALRTAPGKSTGTILVPVLVEAGQTVEDALRYSEHGPVLEVLAALRSIDTEIRHTIDSVRVELGPQSARSGRSGQWIVDAPTAIDEQFAEAVDIAVVDLLNAKRSAPNPTKESLEAEVWDGTTPNPHTLDWDNPRMYELGLEYARACRQDSWTPPWAKGYHEGFSLEKWCDGIYARWAAGQLSQSQKRECAPLLNWLAVPRRKLAKVRHEMARADRRDLAEIVDDWLGLWEPNTGDWELDEAARRRRIGPDALLPTASITNVISKKMPVEQRVRLAKQLLKSGAAVLGNAEAHSLPVAKGFVEALASPGRSHDLDVELKPGKLPTCDFSAYAYGWEAGQAALRVVKSEEERRARRQKQGGRQPRRRRKLAQAA